MGDTDTDTFLVKWYAHGKVAVCWPGDSAEEGAVSDAVSRSLRVSVEIDRAVFQDEMRKLGFSDEKIRAYLSGFSIFDEIYLRPD